MGRHSFKHLLVLSMLAALLSSCGLSRKAAAPPSGKDKAGTEKIIKKYEALTEMRINPRKSLPLYLCIDKWMGTPYRYGAMSRKGTDCSGFSLSLYKEVYSIELPRSSEEQYKKARHVRRRRLKEGQLVFFHIEKGKKVSHVGIYLGNHKFVHASTKKGVRIDDLRDKYYADAFVCGGKFRKTALKP